MKELSIEEKAKAYDEVVNKLKGFMAQGVDPLITRADVKDFFPELKESEGERIRKRIIHALHGDVLEMSEIKEAVDWLEKQGELKPADKVEPKFKVGDWVIDKQDIVHQIANVIENVTNHTYGYDIVGGGYFNDNTEGVRLWTIQDARDGDVLATLDYILIFEKLLPKDGGVSHCHYDFGAGNPQFVWLEDKNWYFGKEAKVYPATKEQRDLLFQKMHEAGYEWDAEKKELRKIEQKPLWGEEDERLIEEAAECLRKYASKVQGGNSKVYVLSLADRIESLRPQNRWKPSDEQMEALEHSLGDYNIMIFEDRHEMLKSLYQDLKKLKKE